MRSHTFIALLALSSAPFTTAIPSPSNHDEHAFRQSEQHSTPLRWRTISSAIFDKIWNLSSSSRQPCDRHGKKKEAPRSREPSNRIMTQYGDDLVLRFNVSTSEEVEMLAEASETLLLDIWEFSHNWVDIRVSHTILPAFLDLLPTSLQTSHVPLMRERELAQAVQNTFPALRQHQEHSQPPTHHRGSFGSLLQNAHGSGENFFFADYQPLSVIEPWMKLMASLFTTHVRHITIGLSYEGRKIPALRVGNHPKNNEDPNPTTRKTILIIGGLHAREWISTSTVNYLAYALITGYGKNQDVTALLEAFDFVFVPTINPDGYVYTWETDRLWRKNRQLTTVRFCQGIDLDHSFDFAWDTTNNPCSESYAGESAFEAVEAKALADWAKNETENNNVEFIGFLDLHSYSQEILYPYSYSCDDPPPGLENLEELAIGLGKAIRMTNSHYYEVLPACEGNVALTSSSSPSPRQLLSHLEPSGGSALDYFYHTLSTRFAYQIKLRDRGTYGFLLPKEHILPTGKEVLAALMYFGEFMRDLYDADGARGSGVGKVRLERLREETEELKEEIEEDVEVGVEDVEIDEVGVEDVEVDEEKSGPETSVLEEVEQARFEDSTPAHIFLKAKQGL